VGRRGTLSQDDTDHRHVRLLDGVDEGLAETQELRLFRDIPHVDAARVLEPDDGHPVAAAEGDELVHLDESLAVELSPHTGVRGILGVFCTKEPLTVSDETDEETVDLGEPRIDLRPIPRPEFHMLTVVEDPCEHFIEIIASLLVESDDAVDVLPGNLGSQGSATRKKFGS
jgi:hypothetical protein